MDGATHGAVYFSLGSHFKSSLLPKDKIQEIINAFSKLPLRVVAKWDAVIENVPENVMFEEWFPQNDILGSLKNVFWVNIRIMFVLFQHIRM